MEDMEGTEEGPVPLDDGPLEDEVLEDMDGGFDNLFVPTFFPRFSHQGAD